MCNLPGMAGFKTWIADDVLTAADVMGFLMQQSVIVVDSGVRPSSPVDGMMIVEPDTKRCYLYDDASSSWVRQAIGLTAAARTGCSLRRNTNQAIGSGGAAIAWDVEDYDSDAFHSGSGSTITVPVAGLYAISANIRHSGGTFGDNAGDAAVVTAGGVTHGMAGLPNETAGDGRVTWAGVVPLAAADTVVVTITNSATENFQGSLHVYRLTP